CGPLRSMVLRSVLPSLPPMYQPLGTLDTSCCQMRSGCPSPFKSAAATILQPGCGTVTLRNLVLATVLPSPPPMYQTQGTLDTSCCQMRSGCPSPFKSAAATILQPGCGTVTLKNLVLRTVLPSAPPMYQTQGTLDPSCCQMRSGCPSPFKSAAATILQPGCGTVTLRNLVLRTVLAPAPPLYHTPGPLAASCCQMRSGCPSPFKSAAATILQPGCGTVTLRNLLLRTVLPSEPPMYQTQGTLLPSCCQIRSGCPSPFKSPAATILQPGCGTVTLKNLVLR